MNDVCYSLLQTDVYKWLKLYEYSIYQFVEIKTVVAYAKILCLLCGTCIRTCTSITI